LPEPDFTRFIDDLGVVGQSYGQYLERDQAMRWLQPQFMPQFRSLLIPRLSVVFDGATDELQRWSQSAIAHVDAQLHERRSSFQRRSESLVRIRSAAENLESRIAEIERQEQQLKRRLEEVESRVRQVVERAAGNGLQANSTAAADQRASA
jgi:predicted  nucleic acid-binding Zn-ribbon protein